MTSRRYFIILITVVIYITIICYYCKNKTRSTKNLDKKSELSQFELIMKKVYNDLSKEDYFPEDDQESFFSKKLLLGIFSMEKSAAIRNALRSTWLTSRYVCPY